MLVEPGIYRTGIHDRMIGPADHERMAEYGVAGDFADRVRGVFQAVVGAPDALGSDDVTAAFIRLVDMPTGSRPFRTLVSATMEQLLGDYNVRGEALRPVVAQIFNTAELSDTSQN